MTKRSKLMVKEETRTGIRTWSPLRHRDAHGGSRALGSLATLLSDVLPSLSFEFTSMSSQCPQAGVGGDETLKIFRITVS